MPRAPKWTPAPDALVTLAITDPHPAQVALLASADARQHALSTGRGHPAQFHGIEVSTSSPSSPATATVVAYVPPGAEHLHVAVWARGHGLVRVTSVGALTGTSVDSEGALLHFQGPSADGQEQAVVTTSVNDGITNGSRAVRVIASPSDTPGLVRLELSLLALSGWNPPTIVGLATLPAWPS